MRIAFTVSTVSVFRVSNTLGRPLHSRHQKLKFRTTVRRPRPAYLNVRACTSSTQASEEDVRKLCVLALPMTSGADVIFPGGSQLLSVSHEAADRLLRTVCESDPPEFVFVCVNAWGDPGEVGTLCIIDDVHIDPSQEKATILCTGISRLHILKLDEHMQTAHVEVFNDDEPTPDSLESISEKEQHLVSTMTQIVQLSIKISEGKDEHKRALNDTLRRVRAFCGQMDEEEGQKLLQPWILKLSPHLRRELFSFIATDLLSISFMDRKRMLTSTDTGERLELALQGLEPYVKELAAKGAIASALGQQGDQSRP
ncbi:ATP-dependent protease La (LON) [Gracilaria domingensis]|nr:ATP-dependent protease La (LON) [Gracilaria domingensis]